VLIEILIGIVTAALLIFFRNASLIAQKQKVAATRLKVYLEYWQTVVLEKDLFGIYHLGVEWNEEVQRIVKDGGSLEDLAALNKEKKKIHSEFKEFIESGDDELVEPSESLKKAVESFPDKHLSDLLKYASNAEQNIIDGKTYISDEDAALFGPEVARVCIELKVNLISLFSSLIMIYIKALSCEGDFDLKDYSTEFSDIMWKAILISRSIDLMPSRMDQYIEPSIFRLTLRNMDITD